MNKDMQPDMLHYDALISLMDDIHILLYVTSHEQRTNAATNIITQYDLHFNVDDIIKTFDCLQNQGGIQIIQHLMHLTLTTNLRMFIAIMYALLDDKLPMSWYGYLICYSYLSPTMSMLGYCWDYNIAVTLPIWSAKQP